jgi:hypothetical protein
MIGFAVRELNLGSEASGKYSGGHRAAAAWIAVLTTAAKTVP